MKRAILVTTLLISSSAWAGGSVALFTIGKAWDSPVTGIKAAHETSIGNGVSGGMDAQGTTHGLTGITVQESGQNPNFVRARFDPVQKDAKKHLDKWMSISGNLESTSDHLDIDLAPNQFAQSIAICTNDKDEKAEIKGIAIDYALELDAEGHVERKFVSKRASSGHCKQWLPRLECPEASVITVLKGFHDGKRYQGLSIKCRRLEKGS